MLARRPPSVTRTRLSPRASSSAARTESPADGEQPPQRLRGLGALLVSETGGSIANRLLWKNLFPRNGNIPSLPRVYPARHQRAGDHRHLSPCKE
jgi:hypothetical protein